MGICRFYHPQISLQDALMWSCWPKLVCWGFIMAIILMVKWCDAWMRYCDHCSDPTTCNIVVRCWDSVSPSPNGKINPRFRWFNNKNLTCCCLPIQPIIVSMGLWCTLDSKDKLAASTVQKVWDQRVKSKGWQHCWDSAKKSYDHGSGINCAHSSSKIGQDNIFCLQSCMIGLLVACIPNANWFSSQ